jgi:thiamine monophosphate synthase
MKIDKKLREKIDRIKLRQKNKKTKSKRNVINELERINAKTGQFMKGLLE